MSPFRGRIRWLARGDLVVRARYGDTDEATRVVRYATVPAGTVQLVRDRGSAETVLLEVVVAEGETTTVSSP